MSINRYVSALLLGFGLLSLATSASAQGNSGMGGNPGGGGGTEGGGTYTALIEGTVEGGSGGDYWTGGPKEVGGNTNNVIALTSISLTELNPVIEGGTTCFADSPYRVSQVIVREGKRGTAEAWFWFTARDNTDETNTDDAVAYLFQMFGTFPANSVWPPSPSQSTTMNLTNWEMKLVNGQKSFKSSSCIDESQPGDPVFEVFLTVTRES